MKKLTRRAAIYWHRKLWDWLYRHPSKVNKKNWPEWSNIFKKYGNIGWLCFPCELAEQDCKECIFDWNSEKVHIPCVHKTYLSLLKNRDEPDSGDGYYGKWILSKSPKTRKKYAKIIRDLPLRKVK